MSGVALSNLRQTVFEVMKRRKEKQYSKTRAKHSPTKFEGLYWFDRHERDAVRLRDAEAHLAALATPETLLELFAQLDQARQDNICGVGKSYLEGLEDALDIAANRATFYQFHPEARAKDGPEYSGAYSFGALTVAAELHDKIRETKA